LKKMKNKISDKSCKNEGKCLSQKNILGNFFAKKIIKFLKIFLRKIFD